MSGTERSAMDVPYISRKCVEQAVREMMDARPPTPNPLERLLLVELALSDREIPLGDQTRWYALQNIIVGLIEREFTKLRIQLGLPLPKSDWQIDDYRDYVRKETSSRNPDALTWSLLYHRVVRTDLDISPAQYCSWIGIVERTYRRYQNVAIFRLTNALIAAEHQARRDFRRRRLIRELPSSVRVRLFGREEILDSVRSSLDEREVRHLYITGGVGIGKTAFAQELARDYINAGKVTELIWIDKPRKVADMRQQLTERLIREDMRMSVRDVLISIPYQVMIVCDEVDLLANALDEFEAWLREMDHALVIFTSKTYLTLNSTLMYVPLMPIDYGAVVSFVCHLLNVSDDDDYGQEMAEGLWQEIGGNPRAIRSALTRLEVETWREVRQNVYQEMFAAVFDNQRASAQIVWCICAIQPRHQSTVEEVSRFWLEYLEHGSFTDLCRALVMRAGDDSSYQLLEEAARYVRHAYASHARIREIVDALIQHLDSQVHRAPEAALVVAQHLLLDDWVGLGEARRAEWIRILCNFGIKHGYAFIWRMLLENQSTLSFDTSLFHAICLRRLGEWAAADAVFDSLVAETGSIGNFEEQAKALLEWSILARLRGEYARAEVMLQRVEMFIKYTHLEQVQNLRTRMLIERAQIASDRQQPAEVLHLLEKVDIADNPRVLLLQSEAALDQRQVEAGRVFAMRVLEIDSQDRLVCGAAWNLIGRSFEQEAKWEEAAQAFISGITYLEQSNDKLGTTRVRGNLGVTLLEQGDYAQARKILQRAEDEFIRLGDRIGAAAMRHNLILLNARVSKRP